MRLEESGDREGKDEQLRFITRLTNLSVLGVFTPFCMEIMQPGLPGSGVHNYDWVVPNTGV